MLLNEIFSKDEAFQRIAKFMDDWQWGRMHSGEDLSKQVPHAIFSTIRRFIPEAIYVGDVYRAIGFDGKMVLQQPNIKGLVRKLLEFKHPNKSQYFAWARSLNGVSDWMSFGGDDAEEADPGVVSALMVVKQHTSSGIDVINLEKKLVEVGALKNTSRASVVEEVMAPYQPPIQPLEFILDHAFIAGYYDKNGYKAEEGDEGANAQHLIGSSTYSVNEFDKMKKAIRTTIEQGATDIRFSKKKSKIDLPWLQ